MNRTLQAVPDLFGYIPKAKIDGATFEPKLDAERLDTQMTRVARLMKDGHWRTLAEIRAIVGGSEAAVSARLRDLRKDEHGNLDVERRRRGRKTRGLWEYRVAGGVA